LAFEQTQNAVPLLGGFFLVWTHRSRRRSTSLDEQVVDPWVSHINIFLFLRSQGILASNAPQGIEIDRVLHVLIVKTHSSLRNGRFASYSYVFYYEKSSSRGGCSMEQPCSLSRLPNSLQGFCHVMVVDEFKGNNHHPCYRDVH